MNEPHPTDWIRKETPSLGVERPEDSPGHLYHDIQMGPLDDIPAKSIGLIAVEAPKESLESTATELDANDTYGELYANTPAKALLWEGTKLLEKLPESLKDAASVELVAAYSVIESDRVPSLIKEISDKSAQLEAWARYSTGDNNSATLERAKKMAGNNIDDLITVGTYGLSKECLEKAYKKNIKPSPLESAQLFEWNDRMFQLANAGYGPAIEGLKKYWGGYKQDKSEFWRDYGESQLRLLDQVQAASSQERHSDDLGILADGQVVGAVGKTVARNYDQTYRTFGWNGSVREAQILSRKLFNDLVESYAGVTSPEDVQGALSDISSEEPSLEVDLGDNLGTFHWRYDLRPLALVTAISRQATALYSAEMAEKTAA